MEQKSLEKTDEEGPTSVNPELLDVRCFGVKQFPYRLLLVELPPAQSLQNITSINPISNKRYIKQYQYIKKIAL